MRKLTPSFFTLPLLCWLSPFLTTLTYSFARVSFKILSLLLLVAVSLAFTRAKWICRLVGFLVLKIFLHSELSTFVISSLVTSSTPPITRFKSLFSVKYLMSEGEVTKSVFLSISVRFSLME